MHSKTPAAAALALAAGLAIAACGGSSAPPAAAPPAAPSAATSHAATPSPAARMGRLTVGQAAREYAAIFDPANRAVAAVGQDVTDAVSTVQFRADVAEAVRLNRVAGGRFAAQHWPRLIQRYVAAMELTDIPDQIVCFEALGRVTPASAGQVNATNSSCIASATDTSADTIRRLLRLPPR
jgi:hypothetical protein